MCRSMRGEPVGAIAIIKKRKREKGMDYLLTSPSGWRSSVLMSSAK